MEAGLVQRIKALNLFLDDVYHDQRILKEGSFPATWSWLEGVPEGDDGFKPLVAFTSTFAERT